MNIYLAGPLFTSAERTWNRVVAAGLRARGHRVFVPQENEPRELTSANIFEHDMGGMRGADVVVANLDGPIADDGTAWECGWMKGQGRPVVGYRTDFRSAEGDVAPVNVMLYESCDEFRLLPDATVEEVVGAVCEMLDAVA